MGTAQIAAHQIGLELWEFSALLLDSFAIAAQSLVGAALGGGDAGTARRTAWQVARYGLGAGIAMALDPHGYKMARQLGREAAAAESVAVQEPLVREPLVHETTPAPKAAPDA